MRKETDTSRPTTDTSNKPRVVRPIDRYAGTCITCMKDRPISETELAIDAEGDPHIVCASCLGELTYIPF